MPGHERASHVGDRMPDPPRSLERRLLDDEARILADEARLAADEKVLRSNRLVALIAVVLAGTVIIAVAGLTVGLFALNRDIETVAKAAPKDNSVGTAALRDGTVTADKMATGSVTSAAIADGAVVRNALANGAIGNAQLERKSVTARNVRRDALTGSQIHEQTLGTVPSAQTASRARTARDAQLLAGLSASAYLSRIKVVRVASSTSQRRTKGPIAARCPSGMRVMSGGAAVDGTSHGVAIARSAPNGREDWVAVANSYRRPTAPWRLVVTAICVAGGR
jgi:hypothetical protein